MQILQFEVNYCEQKIYKILLARHWLKVCIVLQSLMLSYINYTAIDTFTSKWQFGFNKATCIYIPAHLLTYIPTLYLHPSIHPVFYPSIHSFIHPSINTYTHSFTHKHIYSQTCSFKQIWTHTYIRTYVHTYVHSIAIMQFQVAGPSCWLAVHGV